MGALISRFRKKAEESTVDKLNKLESRIKDLEKIIQQDRQQEKRIWTSFLLITIFAYVSVAGIFHLFILETQTILDYAKLVAIWVLPGIMIYFLQRWIPWYFERRIKVRREKVQKLREEKKQILDDVRENEPYNKAKAILEKFEGPQAPLPKPPAPVPQTIRPSSTGSLPKYPVKPFPGPGPQMRAPGPGPVGPRPLVPSYPGQMPYGYGRAPLPRERSTLDRVLDYVVKDGPENRMALICKFCSTHNGLCMLDDFDYTGFKCYACQQLNHPKKFRPPPAPLPFASPSRPNFGSNSITPTVIRDSNASASSTSSSEDEEVDQASAGDAAVVHRAVTKVPITLEKSENYPVLEQATISTTNLDDGDSGEESDNEAETQDDLPMNSPVSSPVAENPQPTPTEVNA